MSIRVLVVEDNEDYRELLNFYLTSRGFEVIIAEDGEKAIELSDSKKPHIILMDLNLPNLDGVAATERITENQSTKHIPIIVISANSKSSTGEMAVNAGAQFCVQKPVDIESLPELILNYAVNDSA
jgi:CheY-like chemotaxis protein